MIADRILSRLDGVRRTGDDRWIARCPAHEDRSPSLAIREVEDRLLLHCFAGCDVYAVVGAAGLQVSDLFPEVDRYETQPRKKLRQPFFPMDAMRCLGGEVTYLEVIATALQSGAVLSDEDKQRLAVASRRFRAAIQACGI